MPPNNCKYIGKIEFPITHNRNLIRLYRGKHKVIAYAARYFYNLFYRITRGFLERINTNSGHLKPRTPSSGKELKEIM